MGEISNGHKTGILVFIISIGIGTLFFLIGNDIDFKFSKPPAAAVGTMEPDFSFPDLEGKTVRLSDYRGKLVLLNIWATWCRPCVDEMPSIERLYNKFKEKGFIVLAVSIDTQGKKVVDPFMKIHKLSFKALLDTKGSIQKAYRTTGVPESFIIDKNGVIIEKVIGSFDWSSPKVFQYFEDQLEKSTNLTPTGTEKLLFIDDEEALAKMGAAMLERLGYDVVYQTDPIKALNLIKADPLRFDLIITDMTMPHLTGDQLTQKILEINPDMPIILSSGFSNRIDRKAALELGIREYIDNIFNLFL